MNAPKRWPQIYIPLGTIIDAVCEVFDLRRAELTSKTHRKTPVLARGAVIIIARHCSPASYPEIGLAIHRHHRSIMNLEQSSNELQKSDPRYAELIQRALARALELMTQRAGKSPGIVKCGELRAVK